MVNRFSRSLSTGLSRRRRPSADGDSTERKPPSPEKSLSPEPKGQGRRGGKGPYQRRFGRKHPTASESQIVLLSAGMKLSAIDSPESTVLKLSPMTGVVADACTLSVTVLKPTDEEAVKMCAPYAAPIISASLRSTNLEHSLQDWKKVCTQLKVPAAEHGHPTLTDIHFR